MKLLILGSNSQLGRALEALLGSLGIGFHGVDGREIELPRKQDVIRLISRHKPDQVINVASYTNLVKAENDPEAAALCDIVNTQGVSVLAEVCSQLDIPLLHHSSSYVFDGQKLRPYEEDEATNPVCRYGLSKWYGERAIRDSWEKHVIVRTDWLFSTWRDNFFRQHIEACKANGGVTAVMNHRFSPTPASDAARVFVAIARQVDCQASVWGTYHYSALQPMTEEHFVETVLKEAMKHDPALASLADSISIKLKPVSLPYIANTTLASQKVMDTFGIKPRSRASELVRVIRNIYEPDLAGAGSADEVPAGDAALPAVNKDKKPQTRRKRTAIRKKPSKGS